LSFNFAAEMSACDRARALQAVADVVQDEKLVESIRSFLNLPAKVPDVSLTNERVTREHFLQWDPQVFMPGSIWRTVSFPPQQDITDSDIFLFVAVVFFVDKKMRDGEPRVWSELVAAWDAQFVKAGEPDFNDRKYGPLIRPPGDSKWPQIPLDLAISGECEFLTHAESAWLTDCLYYYKSVASLEALHDVRDHMVTEGPRWWRKPENGRLAWMPRRFWGANGR
jgi:hypothetical protein